MNRLTRIISDRTEARRSVALKGVARVMEDARSRGIRVSLLGSLANGTFRNHSDVDLFVHDDIDISERVSFERAVANAFRGTGIPYDLIYSRDLTPGQAREFLDD